MMRLCGGFGGFGGFVCPYKTGIPPDFKNKVKTRI